MDMSGIRVAFIDDDSGLITVLDRRLQVLRWERTMLAYAAVPEQLASMRLHALVVNPALTGMEYIEWTARALPGLALIVTAAPMPWPTGCAVCAPVPTTGSPSRAIPRSSSPGSKRCCAAAGPVRATR